MMEFQQIVDMALTAINFLPVEMGQTVLSVIGGFALVATGVAKPDSRYSKRAYFIYKAINLLGANVGKAKNRD